MGSFMNFRYTPYWNESDSNCHLIELHCLMKILRERHGRICFHSEFSTAVSTFAPIGLCCLCFCLFHLHVMASENSSHKPFHLCQISIAKCDHTKLSKQCVTVLSMCTQHDIKRLHTVFTLAFTHALSFSFISQSIKSTACLTTLCICISSLGLSEHLTGPYCVCVYI